MAIAKRVLIPIFGVAVALAGCSDDGGSSDKDAGKEDAGEEDAGEEDAGEEDAGKAGGEPVELPDKDSMECTDALEAGFTPYDEAGCMSSAKAETKGNCAGFFCNWSEDQLLCNIGKLTACKTDVDLDYGCDSTLQDTVATCARNAAQDIVSMQIDRSEYEDAITECSVEALPKTVTPSCLDCYVQSAGCAFDECLVPCLSGDSPECDGCRETTGCTPDFFKCTGFPDPQQVNPDGTDR